MRLLACTETVTLIRHVQTDHGDAYPTAVISGVSWFEKAGSTLSGNGEAPDAEIIVRIPADVCPEEWPKAEDYLVRGRVTYGLNPGGQTLNALAQARKNKMDFFRIAKVGNNMRQPLPHLVVKSK